MIYLLDTNTLIYLIKNKPPSVAQRVNALAKDVALGMSFVTYAELLKGAERSTRKSAVLRQLDHLVSVAPVFFETNTDFCRHYAVQSARLRSVGTPIGGNDLWIACHALMLDATLVTNNLREFERIEGLRLENWVE
uniref:Ribonuclease VapC n=1 Tax=Candidatus Kentrum sp. DK TaxID=2126562 RepID=A0A450T6R6_9GAMM|nr:MAG: tRNA(fMet)-specific endonuclease VapC [Candidatus Kentron sp. DK]